MAGQLCGIRGLALGDAPIGFTMKCLLPLLAIILLGGISFAQGADSGSSIASGIGGQLCNIRTLVVAIIPTLALIMFLLAGALAVPLGGGGILLWIYSAKEKANARYAKIAVAMFAVPAALFALGVAGLVVAALAPLFLDTFASMGGTELGPCLLMW